MNIHHHSLGAAGERGVMNHTPTDGYRDKIMIIKRGILQSFDPTTYSASVLLLEATSSVLTGLPVANTGDGTSAQPGAWCAILFFDEHNPQDAVIVAMFPNGAGTYPSPPAGRITFVPGYQQLNSVNIAANSTQTFTLVNSYSGIPNGALGVIYKAYFTSATVGAYIQLAPHGASNIGAYVTIGNLAVANGYMNDTGLLSLDANGNIDIKANGGTCVVTLYTYGYII